MKIFQILKTDKTTQTIRAKFPVFVVTFQYGSEVCDVFEIKRIMSCIIQWEKHEINKPICQCFNCQSFGRSSNFCGKLSRRVKCNRLHTTQGCKKPTDKPAKYVSGGRTHTDSFTECPLTYTTNLLTRGIWKVKNVLPLKKYLLIIGKKKNM